MLKKQLCSKQNCCCEKSIFNVENVEQLIMIMNMYLSDWQQRMIMYWQKNFTLFFADVVVTIFPFTTIWGNNLSDKVDVRLFPIMGMAMSLFYFCIVVCDANRLNALSAKYKELQQYLPDEYRWKNLNNEQSMIDMMLNMPIIRKISILMSWALFGMNLYVLYIANKLV